MSNTTNGTQPLVSLDDRVAQYVRLRDVIKEKEAAHKEALAPYKKGLEDLGSLIMARMDAAGVDAVKTSSGTAYFSHKNSATIADGEAFMRHVIGTEAWELLDKRANSTAVATFLEENGSLPPGVNFNSIRTIGVRRA